MTTWSSTHLWKSILKLKAFRRPSRPSTPKLTRRFQPELPGLCRSSYKSTRCPSRIKIWLRCPWSTRDSSRKKWRKKRSPLLSSSKLVVSTARFCSRQDRFSVSQSIVCSSCTTSKMVTQLQITSGKPSTITKFSYQSTTRFWVQRVGATEASFFLKRWCRNTSRNYSSQSSRTTSVP